MIQREEPIWLDVEGPVAALWLNRPQRNTMTVELMSGFMDCMNTVRSNPSIRALMIASTEGHFCAGAELTRGLPGEVQALGGPPGTAVRLRAVYQPFLSVLDLPIPTVAAVRKAAVGGGFGLAVACDFRVVSPSTRFLAPFAKLGINPGMALTHLLPTLIGMPRAMEMLMLGRDVRGEEAHAWGLATSCVPETDLLETAATLTRQLADSAPAVMRFTKSAVHRGAGLDAHRAADLEALAQALTFGSQDADEGMQAFLEKRKPRFTGE